MNWSEERYVRVYTRDTLNWLALSYDAQALLLLLLRKVDRAGRLPLGRQGRGGVGLLLGAREHWETRIQPALAELVASGCLVEQGEGEDAALVFPNFRTAQEAQQSEAARKRAQRERDKAGVTKRDGTSRNVTRCHAVTDAVTRSRTESPQPSQPSQPTEKETQPPPSAPAAQAEKGRKPPTGPEAEAYRYWCEVIWPQLSDLPYSGQQKDHVQLARVLKVYDLATVKACLDRVPADHFWRGQDLAAVCAGITKLLPRKQPQADRFRYGEPEVAP